MAQDRKGKSVLFCHDEIGDFWCLNPPQKSASLGIGGF